MFTPPPSPLPPRHPPVLESLSDDDDDGDDDNDANGKLTLSPEEKSQRRASVINAIGPTETNTPPFTESSSELTSYARIKRRLLVFMVPLILLIVCSTSSFIAGQEERSTYGNAPVWRETIEGTLRDPNFPPVVPAPAHHMLSSLSKHLHRTRLYGVGRARTPSFPIPPTNEPRDRDDETDESPVVERVVFADKAEEGGPSPVALAAASPTVNGALETAPSIPSPAWPVPTPCKHISFTLWELFAHFMFSQCQK